MSIIPFWGRHQEHQDTIVQDWEGTIVGTRREAILVILLGFLRSSHVWAGILTFRGLQRTGRAWELLQGSPCSFCPCLTVWGLSCQFCKQPVDLWASAAHPAPAAELEVSSRRELHGGTKCNKGGKGETEQNRRSELGFEARLLSLLLSRGWETLVPAHHEVCSAKLRKPGAWRGMCKQSPGGK